MMNVSQRDTGSRHTRETKEKCSIGEVKKDVLTTKQLL